MSKVIFSGLESSGKSLKLAMLAEQILFRNANWKRKSGITRPIATNFPFSKKYIETAEELGIPVILWKDLDELVLLRDVDIFMDEIGTYFDSRLWTELSLDVRRWIQQGAKMGIELYGASQDFAQIDVSFRRLVSELYWITKLIGSARPSNTKPPIKTIWGICSMFELDVRNYDEKDKKFIFSGFISLPRIFFITRHYCEIFDTKYFIEKSKPLVLKHVERHCPECGTRKIIHT